MSFIFIFFGFVFISMAATVIKKTVKEYGVYRLTKAFSIIITVTGVLYQWGLDYFFSFYFLIDNIYPWLFLKSSLFVLLSSLFINLGAETRPGKVKKINYLIVNLLLAGGGYFVYILTYEDYIKTSSIATLFKSYIAVSLSCVIVIDVVLCLIKEKNMCSLPK